tara:strand:- start:6602 stop:7708 length:1107 start_codon:yes stop_codon:yes gene_type:complete
MALVNRVIWDENDKQLIVSEAARMYVTKEESAKTPALIAAMKKMLPADKQRHPIGLISNVKTWFHKNFNAEVDRLNKSGLVVVNQNGKQTRKERIIWSGLEKKFLAENCAKFMNDWTAKTLSQALFMSQSLLPENRRRGDSAAGNSSWLLPAVNAERKKQLSEEISSDKKELFSAAAALDAEIAAHHENVQTSPALALPAPAFVPPANNLTATLLTLREQIVDVMVGIFSDALLKAVAQTTSSLTRPAVDLMPQPIDKPTKAHDPRMHSEPRPLMLSVLVVGCKGTQPEMLKREFGHKLNLNFYSSDQSKYELRAKVDAADKVLVWASFVSHSHTDVINARKKDAVVVVHGGMDGLRTQLHIMIANAP